MTLVRGSHQFAVGAERGPLDVPLGGQCAFARASLVDGAVDRLAAVRLPAGRTGGNERITSRRRPNTLDMAQTYLGVYAQDTWR